MWGGVGRCGEMWGDVGRCGEIRGAAAVLAGAAVRARAYVCAERADGSRVFEIDADERDELTEPGLG